MVRTRRPRDRQESRGIFCLALSFSVLGGLALLAGAAEPNAAGDNSPQHWLKLAEQAAGKIDNAKPDRARDAALANIAVTWADCGNAQEARRVLNRLPTGQMRASYMAFAAASLVARSDLVAAERLARDSNWPRALPLLAGAAVDVDSSRALALAKEAGEPYPDRVRCMIVRRRVLMADLPRAEALAKDITDANKSAEARRWVEAGRLADRSDLAGALKRLGADQWYMQWRLGQIAECRGEDRRFDDAERIIRALPSLSARAGSLLKLARQRLDRGDREACRLTVSEAINCIEHDPNRTDGMVAWGARMQFAEAASLLAGAGDRDGALRAARRIDTRPPLDPNSPAAKEKLFRLLAGQDLKLQTLAEIGAIGDPEALARREDGTYDPNFVPLLVISCVLRGHPERAQRLIEGTLGADEKCEAYTLAACALIHRQDGKSGRRMLSEYIDVLRAADR